MLLTSRRQARLRSAMAAARIGGFARLGMGVPGFARFGVHECGDAGSGESGYAASDPHALEATVFRPSPDGAGGHLENRCDLLSRQERLGRRPRRVRDWLQVGVND